MAIKTVLIGGQSAEIEGDPADTYFKDVASNAADMARLAGLAGAQVSGEALVLDIGANIGLSTIALARAVPQGRVIAFEPSPKNAEFLRRNLANNGIANAQVVQAAVSDRAGTLRFHESPAFGAGSHVVGRDHIHGSMSTASVPSLSVDEFLPEGGQPVAFVKVDCEGHEPEVIAGARRTLSRDTPLLFLEFNAWTLNAFAGHSPAAFASALWTHFEVSYVAPDGSLIPAPELSLVFLHDTLVKSGCVADLAIRPRRDTSALTLLEMTASPSLRAALADRAAEAAALTTSTSWRITAPLRALARLIR